jgi:hypothetical protein
MAAFSFDIGRAVVWLAQSHPDLFPRLAEITSSKVGEVCSWYTQERAFALS